MPALDRRRDRPQRWLLVCALAQISCARDPPSTSGLSAGAGSGDSGSASGPDASDPDVGGSAGGSGGSGAADSDGAKFDTPDGATGGPGPTEPTCHVVDDMDAVIPCVDIAPPGSFTPDVQWSFGGEEETQSVTTPLVGNLTDDNGDGVVDLCDVPDVVVVLYPAPADPNGIPPWEGHIYVLDGATGVEHFRIGDPVIDRVTPAIGDIDGDGVMEIVTMKSTREVASQHLGRLAAFDNLGNLRWESAEEFAAAGPVSLADVDNDGDVEIYLSSGLFDHVGNRVADAPYAAIMVDLDGDADLELVAGSATEHDGTPLWDTGRSGYPQVADIDDDGDPEIILVYYEIANGLYGVARVEHDGTVSAHVDGLVAQVRPAAIHDLDSDGVPDVLLADVDSFRAVGPDLGVRWSAAVHEASGFAGSTAFDFLGDGSADAIYADEQSLFVWDGAEGVQLMDVPRSSWTFDEFPVVADVDNDQSAEIVVVSNDGYAYLGGNSAPAVQVIRDVDDRWIPARRIWNQHNYFVTNVREDGTIPQFQVPHWGALNTFRTQAQLAAGGGLCQPRPAG